MQARIDEITAELETTRQERDDAREEVREYRSVGTRRRSGGSGEASSSRRCVRGRHDDGVDLADD